MRAGMPGIGGVHPSAAAAGYVTSAQRSVAVAGYDVVAAFGLCGGRVR